jgi:hypothetical protein
MASPRTVSATLSVRRTGVGASPEASPSGDFPWWIAPLIVVAGVAGVGLQIFLTCLWIVAKGNLH